MACVKGKKVAVKPSFLRTGMALVYWLRRPSSKVMTTALGGSVRLPSSASTSAVNETTGIPCSLRYCICAAKTSGRMVRSAPRTPRASADDWML